MGIEVEEAAPIGGLPLPPPTGPARIVGVELGRSQSLGFPPGSPRQRYRLQRPQHAAPAAVLAPPAGAGLAVMAHFGAASGIMQWQGGAAQLLQRSMSSPLLGDAEQGQASAEAALPAGPPSRASSGAPSTPSGSAGGAPWSQEVLAEARMRLVAGAHRLLRVPCTSRKSMPS
jgi:hypothetical protein